jgi:hypothetical protein
MICIAMGDPICGPIVGLALPGCIIGGIAYVIAGVG